MAELPTPISSSDARDAVVPTPAAERRCAQCGTPFTETWPNTGMFENVLEVRFTGGYGWFVDPLAGDLVVHLCHDCAHLFCETHPWAAEIIQPLSSHSHRPGTVPDDHPGWDREPDLPSTGT